jgi:transposase InsO family protein
MEQHLHKNAKTTYSIRKEIKEASGSIADIARQFHISWDTANKWKKADNLTDKSSRPNKLRTDLTKEQEDLICFERKQYKKTLDEIYVTLEEQIPNLYPMKIYRCLRRHSLNILPEEFVEAERKIRKFRKYGIGYLHIDLLYAPKINKVRHYVYTAIDRVSKLAFLYVGEAKTKELGSKFLDMVIKYYPYKINYILTDNGFEFSYKALCVGKRTKKEHPFDEICRLNKIQHRTIKFRHPWTNGMVERFNRKVRDKVLKMYEFSSIIELNSKLIDYINRYNFDVKLRGLGYRSPVQYLIDTKNLLTERIVI